MKRIFSTIATISSISGLVLIFTSVILAIYFFTDELVVRELSSKDKATAKAISNSPFTDAAIVKPKEKLVLELGLDKSELKLEQNYWKFEIPANTAVTHGAQIRVPSIGVDTSIFESQFAEYGLVNGVWRLPEHGAPDRPGPFVLAAHRWGFDGLSQAYREQHLFNKLPDLKVGEEIIINWNNKIFKYKVTAVEDNDHVSRIDDMILVTCRYYDSMQRVFIYAKMETQAI
jgi:LPXTG-site transpeptidase (sortase) family protein